MTPVSFSSQITVETEPVFSYEANQKHKEPWQRGRRGSICSIEASEQAQALLDVSELWEGKRYSMLEGRAYCGQEHAPGCWHGYPVGWKEVPEPVRRKWFGEGKITRRDQQKFWESHQ